MEIVIDYFGAYAKHLAPMLQDAFSDSYQHPPAGLPIPAAPESADYQKVSDAAARVLRSCNRVAEREVLFCPIDGRRVFFGITVAGMTAGGLEHMNQAIDALAHGALEKIKTPFGHLVRFMPDSNWPEKLLSGATEGLRPL